MNINLKNNYDILLINLVYLKSNGKKKMFWLYLLDLDLYIYRYVRTVDNN